MKFTDPNIPKDKGPPSDVFGVILWLMGAA
jgi:hypothetical protein